MTPVAPATALFVQRGRSGPYWQLTVPQCPICGQTHVHGGGDGPEPSYGHRAAHCSGRAAKEPGTAKGYELVPA